MKLQEEALAVLAERLSAVDIPYMVIGGYANAVWGEPRATLDIDIVLWRPELEVNSLLSQLGPEFRPRVAEAAAFVDDSRVLPLVMGEDVQVDLIFALFPFEETAIRRATSVPFAGAEVRVATAEDLIVLKIVSPRDKDLEDIRGVLRRRRDELDFEYLNPLIEELSETLERPEILQKWLSLRSGEGR